MPKSYKICPASEFDSASFGEKPYSLRPQMNMEGVPPPPETLIRMSADKVAVEDFQSYHIEHERVVSQRGRLNSDKFTQYIRMGEILGYYSKNRALLLLCGKKDDILDFCRSVSSSREMTFATIAIDMKGLLAKLKDVRLAWFKYDDTIIHASALAGQHIETTRPFKEANAIGDISTLSFYVEDAGGIAHPILTTSVGAVVLQANYQERSTEIELVLRIKEVLLDGIFREVPLRQKRIS
jgi:hypothetical protein